MTQAPAGWHPQGNVERYWDGGAWTDQTRPIPVAPQPVYYAPQPVKQSHTARNILIVLGVLFILGVGGCLAVVGLAGNAVNDAIEEAEADDAKPGGPDNPLTIVEGQAFEVDGFSYAAGWSVGKDSIDDVDVQGLKVTNNRDKKDSALVEIKFWNGSEVLALADCTTEPIAQNTTTAVSCFSADKLPAAYDKITINDTF
jgi:hypothetical protein